MSANPVTDRETDDPFAETAEPREHAAEPWQQDGRYIRDAFGAIVVRGRSVADARRIVAAINGVRGIPTEALERLEARGRFQSSDAPGLRSRSFPRKKKSRPTRSLPPSAARPNAGSGERRAAVNVPDPQALVFDRRVFQRRREDRRRG